MGVKETDCPGPPLLVETDCQAAHMSVSQSASHGMRPHQQRSRGRVDTHGELVASYVAKIRVCLGVDGGCELD